MAFIPPVYLIRSAVVCSGILCLAFLCEAGGQPQSANPAKPGDEETPARKVLTGDDAKRVAELEKKIDELQAAGRFAEALGPAREVAEIRTRVQGAKDWQTANASRRVRTLTEVAALSVEAQVDFASAWKLDKEGTKLYERGRFAEAESLFQKVLAIYRRVLGEDHPDTANSYNNVAANLDAQGKYAKAEPLHQKALAIRRRVLGEDHPDAAESYNNMAANLDAQGKYTEAEPLYQKALAIRQKLLGEDHSDTTQSYNNMAANLYFQGKYAEAERLYQKALATYRRVLGEHHSDTATSYNNMAVNLNAQGKYAEAEPLYQKALAIRRRVLGEDHPRTATSYHNVAANLYAQGKYAEAEKLCHKALAIRRRVVGEDHPHTASSYNDMAVNLNAQGKYAEAEPLYQKALAIRRRVLGEDHPDTATSYHNVAANLNAQGKYAEAEPLYQKALAIRRRVLGENHPVTAISYGSVAANLNGQGKYAEAEEQWTKAARSFDNARLGITFVGLDRATFATERSPLPSLAALLARQGKAEAAWQRWEANLARGLLDDLSARLARPLNDEERRHEQQLIGRLQVLDKQVEALLSGQDLTEARRQQADKLREQRDAVWGEFTQFQAELAKPDKYGPAAGQIYELKDIQAQLPAQAALVAWLDLKGEPKAADPNGEHWACVLRQHGQPVWVPLTGSGPHGAWTDADEQLPKRVRDSLAAKPEVTIAEWRKLTGQLYRQRLAPLAQHLRAGEGLPAVQHLIILPSVALAGVPVEALVEARTDDQPRYTVSYAPSGTTFAWLQEQRHTAEARGPRGRPARLLALGDPVFTRPAQPAPPAPPAPDHGVLLTQVVPQSNAARAGLQRGDVVLTYAGTKLSGPADLEPALGKNSGLAPPEAGIPVTLWREGQTLTLSVRPGPLGVKPSKQPAAEAIRERREADALVQRSRGETYDPLPGTRREVEAIARLFPQTETLLEAQASEQQLDQLAAAGRLREFDVLHLATHGKVNPQVALHSALILAQDNLPDPLERVLAGQPAYDGKLTAEQILRTWKLNADLVTLSACDTGLGKYSGGEGYLGFAQALFLAGARSLVLSLWRADDAATALLMTRFYQNLLGSRKDLNNPLSKAEALHEAKHWLRTLTFEERDRQVAGLPRGEPRPFGPALATAPAHPYAHPYFWAGFILIGDPK